MSRYLERLVQQGRTTLGQLRAPAARVEEPDLEVVESNEPAPRAVSPPAAEERVVIVEGIVRGEPAVEHSAEVRVTPAPPAQAKPSTPRPAQPIEPAGVSVRSAPAVRQPSLRDAGIRSAEPLKQSVARVVARPLPPPLSAAAPAKQEEPPRAPPHAKLPEAHWQQPPAVQDVPRPREAPRQRAEIPPEQVEQWERLRERLLVAYPPASLQAPTPPKEPGKSRPEARSAARAQREVVIRNLEVTVAAPPAHVPPAPAPQRTTEPYATTASGAWTVAARRYLGRV